MAFRMANIKTFEVKNEEEAIRTFKSFVAQKDAGIIIVSDIIASMLQKEIAEFSTKNTRPLVLEIPSSGSLASGRKNGTKTRQKYG